MENLKFYDTLTMYPQLQLITDAIHDIKYELNNYQYNWINWVEKKLYIDNGELSIIPIYGFDKWTKCSDFFPKLTNIIKRINGVKLVAFSKLNKDTILTVHKGWKNHSNYVIRNHIGITVPEKCGIWCEGKKCDHENYKWLSFDDSKYHTAYNSSISERIILIIDIERPNYLKLGTSNVEDSTELKIFLENI